MLTILLLFIGILDFLIALIAIVRTRKLTNVLFALVALSIGLWSVSIGLFLRSTNADEAFVWARIYYLIAAVFPVLLYSLVKAFPYGKLNIVWPLLLSGAAAGIVATVIVVAPNLLIRDVIVAPAGKTVILNPPAYIIYTLYFILTFYLGIISAVKKFKKEKGNVKYQLKYLTYGILFTSIPGLFSNLLLPAVGEYRYIWVGPLVSIIFLGGTAYSIIKHRLFDIQLIVARSLAYTLSWGLLTSIYAIILVNASSMLFGADVALDVELLTYIFVGLALATGLAPLKRFFDKVTNRLFYRDAYDGQLLIEALNRIIVSSFDVEVMLRDSAAIIQHNIKSEYCMFVLGKTAYMPMRVLGTKDAPRAIDSAVLFKAAAPKNTKSIVITDELEEGQSRLKTLLQSHNIAVLAGLNTKLKHEIGSLGFLILGPKKSGSPYTTRDLKILTIIANEMVIAIQNTLSYEEIENFNATLQQKVTEATKELKRTNEKLKALDETKDEFISMASHQLRTPLTSVKGYVSMVLEGDAGEVNDTQRKLLEQAFTSSQRMVYLIADLLNVSRLQTGKFIIEAAPTNLAELVEEEVKQLVDTAKGRGLHLVYNKPKTFPELMLDQTKTRQVIMNFIDNAIYYTPEGGTVTIDVTETAESAQFTVTDNGIGVPKQEQHHLFNKFYRAGNARKARPDGTGLGLFMAKKVIIAQGGAIVFRSEEGKGSTFGFSFAKAKLAPPAITPAEQPAVTAHA